MRFEGCGEQAGRLLYFRSGFLGGMLVVFARQHVGVGEVQPRDHRVLGNDANMKPFFLIPLILCGLVAGLSRTADGTVSDSFESAETSWQIIHRDCWYKLDEHRRSWDLAHSGAGSEYVRITAKQGTAIYLAQRVPPARVIAELATSVWVKSDRSGFQLLVRVVLPRTLDPATNAPWVLYLPGDIYGEAGAWRQLRLERIDQRLEQQVRILRQRNKGLRIDPLEAYVDHLLLNIHPGPGTAQVWLDDLAVTGYATAARPDGLVEVAVSSANPGSGSANPAMPGAITTRPGVRLQGGMVMVGERPFFARMIEYRGESLAWLQALGFNSVKMDTLPTPAECDEAARLGLWLVVPAPRSEAERLPESTPNILAYYAGGGWTERDQLAFRDQTRRLRGLADGRLLAAGVRSGARQLSTEIDLVDYQPEVIGSSAELALLGERVQAFRESIQLEQPFWVTIPTEPSVEQLEQLMFLFGEGGVEAGEVEAEQMRLTAFRAIGAGARGLLFSSQRRLDARTPITLRRAMALHALNLELATIEPWAAAGIPASGVSCSDPRMATALLKTDRARLLIATHQAAQQQFIVGGGPTSAAVNFDIRGLPITDQAYLVQHGDLKPILTRVGNALPCTEPQLVNLILLTQDPLAVNHLSRTLRESQAAATSLQHQQTVSKLIATSTMIEQLTGQGQTVTDAATALQDARFYTQQSEQLLQSGDYANVWKSTHLANQRLQTLRHATWKQTVAVMPSPISSPLCTSFSLLPFHIEFARRPMNWSVNMLPGGDFEDLQHLLRSGWRQQRHAPPDTFISVDLLNSEPHSGRSALSIQVRAAQSDQRFEEPWPVVLTSAPVAVRAGRLYRISGWVKVPHYIKGSQDGLFIYDSMTGHALGERIISTRGWQAFTLYRMSPREGPLTVTFAMTGSGEVWIDDVTISIANQQ